MGIIGIKKDSSYPTQFFYEKNVHLVANDIAGDSKIYVHKAFYASLKINTKDLEQDRY